MKEDDLPAFPIACDLNNSPTFYKGLTKREWFAGMALQGYRSQKDGHLFRREAVAEWSFEDADAMMAEGKK